MILNIHNWNRGLNLNGRLSTRTWIDPQHQLQYSVLNRFKITSKKYNFHNNNDNLDLNSASQDTEGRFHDSKVCSSLRDEKPYENMELSAASELTSFFIKLSDECFPPFGRMHTSGAGDLVGCQCPARGAGTRVEARSHGRKQADMSAGTSQAVIFT